MTDTKAAEPIVAPKHTVTEFSGTIGGPFAMYGTFGDPGTVTVNGRQILKLTAWRNGSVKGEIPIDIPRGDVEIAIDGVVVGKGKL